MATKAKMRQVGNSTGITFNKSVLKKAGMSEKSDVRIDAAPGRIVLSVDDGSYARSMEILEKSFGRYGRAYKKLAK